MEITGLETAALLPGACSSQGHRDSPEPRFEPLHARASSSLSPHAHASSRTTSPSTALLTFPSPELEAAFQTYLTGKPNMWTLVNIGHCVVGWTCFCYKYLAAPQDQRALLLDRWYLGGLPMVTALASLGLLLLCPSLYRKHRRALHALHILVLIASFRYSRDMLLWYQQLEGPSAASLAQRVQLLASENFFGSLIWLLVLAYPVGRVPDLALATLFLLEEIMANPLICSAAGRLRLEGLATMSPEPLRVVEAVTGWIRGTPAGTLGGIAGATLPRIVTCPLALAFWQVVGWWAACHLVFTAEICKRREFLRTTAARDLVGSAHLASALTWPFGRVTMVLDLALVSVSISACASIVWLVLLFHANT